MAAVRVRVVSTRYYNALLLFIADIYSTVLRLEPASESPGHLVKTQVIGPHTQSF